MSSLTSGGRRWSFSTPPAASALPAAPGPPLWGLPGGKIRNGESPIHAVIRDVREETGTEIEIVDLVGIYQPHRRRLRRPTCPTC